jgi:hypothetical protein
MPWTGQPHYEVFYESPGKAGDYLLYVKTKNNNRVVRKLQFQNNFR